MGVDAAAAAAAGAGDLERLRLRCGGNGTCVAVAGVRRVVWQAVSGVLPCSGDQAHAARGIIRGAGTKVANVVAEFDASVVAGAGSPAAVPRENADAAATRDSEGQRGSCVRDGEWYACGGSSSGGTGGAADGATGQTRVDAQRGVGIDSAEGHPGVPGEGSRADGVSFEHENAGEAAETARIATQYHGELTKSLLAVMRELRDVCYDISNSFVAPLGEVLISQPLRGCASLRVFCTMRGMHAYEEPPRCRG